MDKEKKIKIIVVVVCFLLILAALKFAIYRHDISIFLISAGFLLLVLIILEAYLRIQHNIERANINTINEIIKVTETNSANVANAINETKQVKMYLDSKFTGEKDLYEELVGFFDNILNYLEDNKKEVSDAVKNLQTEIKESKDFQGKIVVLLQQILDYQQDQTNFLKEEINKLKNEHIHKVS